MRVAVISATGRRCSSSSSERARVIERPAVSQAVVRRLEGRVCTLLHHERDQRRVLLSQFADRRVRRVRRTERRRRRGRRRVRAELDAELGRLGGPDRARVCRGVETSVSSFPGEHVGDGVNGPLRSCTRHLRMAMPSAFCTTTAAPISSSRRLHSRRVGCA
jgi:hypothetical protein